MYYIPFSPSLIYILLIYPDISHLLTLYTINGIQICFFTLTPLFTNSDPTNEGIFDTVTQSLAAIIAIVFSISLFVIEKGTKDYSYKLLKFFKENYWTKILLFIGVFTILISLFFSLLNISNIYLNTIIFILFTLNIILFGKYYYKMVEIINPYKIADLLLIESKKIIKNENLDDFKDIITSIMDIIQKTASNNDKGISLKYISILLDIYNDVCISNLSPNIKINFKDIFLNQIFLEYIKLIKENNELKEDIWYLFFEIVELEINQ
ncbi:hypothetical protein [Methanospirillum lacunae]|uniref:DUF2254 domain-containing protein n=1 Tax=Methanospirillum lacunae TaxID=668570 RepID=A0A2V2N343_9EURY|nr:hypothetical protein [Methanospirillum lacunae]PWR74199.1 hypothetical protein DK846_03355 [Methanospirillum lacunae]